MKLASVVGLVKETEAFRFTKVTILAYAKLGEKEKRQVSLFLHYYVYLAVIWSVDVWSCQVHYT